MWHNETTINPDNKTPFIHMFIKYIPFSTYSVPGNVLGTIGTVIIKMKSVFIISDTNEY